MFGNGAAIGMAMIIMLNRLKTILRVLLRVLAAFCEVAVGPPTIGAAAFLLAIAAAQPSTSASTVSGWLLFHNSKTKSGGYPKKTKVQSNCKYPIRVENFKKLAGTILPANLLATLKTLWHNPEF